jgi:hypothetical protein
MPSQKLLMNIGQILNIYGAMDVWNSSVHMHDLEPKWQSPTTQLIFESQIVQLFTHELVVVILNICCKLKIKTSNSHLFIFSYFNIEHPQSI